MLPVRITPKASLSEIAASLSPGEVAHITYLPAESQHWRLLELVSHEGKPTSVATIKEYREEIERLGLTIVSAELTHSFAFYESQEKLIQEIRNNPLIWPVKLSNAQIEALAEMAARYSLTNIREGAVNFPYTLIKLIVQSSS